jgi:hypothetical protein
LDAQKATRVAKLTLRGVFKRGSDTPPSKT